MYLPVTVRRRLLIAAVFVLGMCTGLVRAQGPQPPSGVQPAVALGSSFTYQGQLRNASGPISGTCDLQFGLFDAVLTGTQVGTTQDRAAVPVANGLFTVALSFGATAFNGQARFLEIAARCPAGSGTFTTLSPRQELTPTPYALQSTTSSSTNAIRGKTVVATAPTSGQVLKFNGSTWAPAVDDNTQYTAGSGLTLSGTEFSVVTSTVQMRVTGDCAGSSAIAAIAADGSVRCQSGAAGAWQLGGNAGTDPATQFLGTTDNQALELRVNGVRVLRLEPNVTSPNLLGGHITNALLAGVVGVTIAGGGASNQPNRVTDDYGTIGGGADNQAGDNAGTTADRTFATVGGGESNTASGDRATVGGGEGNTASGQTATVGGGESNTASGFWATVGGGLDNSASSSWATVGGGFGNSASGNTATVGGGFGNIASGFDATVAGGERNTASGLDATVGGGANNTANRPFATVSGGQSNTATGAYATIGGGGRSVGTDAATANRVTDNYGTVGGGGNNQAGDNAAGVRIYATVGGGLSNTASGSQATVPGGESNTASGTRSFAAGFRAKANHSGAFVWADNKPFDFASTVNNQFRVRATGGVDLVTGINATTGDRTTGCALPAGSGSFSCTSDRNAKANFAAVDSRSILQRLLSIQIQMWNYKTQDAATQHIGPMAQDFAEAFDVGESDTTISMVDADGVALAGIQGLYHVMQEENATLEADNRALETRLQAIEQALQAGDIPVQANHSVGLDVTLVLILVLGGLLLLVLGLLAGLLLGRHSSRRAAVSNPPAGG